MRLIPSSTARWRTACAAAGSAGSPQTSGPGSRMAPKPRRRTSRSPIRMVSGPDAKRSIDTRCLICASEASGPRATHAGATHARQRHWSAPGELEGEGPADDARLATGPHGGEAAAQLIERAFAGGGDQARGGRPGGDVADQLVAA